MSLNLYKYHADSESLVGFDQVMDSVPDLAWEHYKHDHEELRKREHVWAKSAQYSYLYVNNVLKKSFPEGEPAIAGDAKYSYLYANFVLRARFLEGEPAIRGSVWQEDYEQLFGIEL